MTRRLRGWAVASAMGVLVVGGCGGQAASFEATPRVPATPLSSLTPSPTPSSPIASTPIVESAPPQSPSPSPAPSQSPAPPHGSVLGTVTFADASHGWIGANGAIYRSADGGATWTVTWRGSGTIVELSAPDVRHVWAVVAPGERPDDGLSHRTLLASTDGGSTWTPTTLSVSIASLRMLDASRGWAVSITGPSSAYNAAPAGNVVRTSDGGRTWRNVAATGRATSVCATSGGMVWASGGIPISASADGGATWHTAVPLEVPSGTLPSTRLGCDGDTVWALYDAGEGMSQQAYLAVRSGDRGRTWKPVYIEGYFAVAYGLGNATGIGVLDSYSGAFAVPSRRAGRFLGLCPVCTEYGPTWSLTRTDDAGTTSRRAAISAIEDATSADLAFPDALHGWIVATEFAGESRSVVLATSDGGATWREVHVAP